MYECGINVLITVGKAGLWTTEAAIESGLDKKPFFIKLVIQKLYNG